MVFRESSTIVLVKPTDIEYILEPLYRCILKRLQPKFPENIEDIEDISTLAEYNVSEVYRALSYLTTPKELAENFKKQLSIEKEDRLLRDFMAKIDLFVKKGLIIRIEIPGAHLRLSPERLLITPLGLSFLYCFRKGLLDLRQDLNANLLQATRFLGLAYNTLVISNTLFSVASMERYFSKKELILTFLLLSLQATSAERALKVDKSTIVHLAESVKRIGEEIFGNPNILPDKAQLDEAIRRSPGAQGLEGKTFGCYVRKGTRKEGYRLYFQLEKGEDNLWLIVNKLFESIREHEERDKKLYSKNVMELLMRHIRDRGFLMPIYIRSKILSADVDTGYLQKLLGYMKKASGK